jgi:hypothetical protein
VLLRLVPWAAAAVILVLFIDWLGGPSGPASVFRDSIGQGEPARERSDPGAAGVDALRDAAERASDLVLPAAAAVVLLALAFLLLRRPGGKGKPSRSSASHARAARRSKWEWPAPPWMGQRPPPRGSPRRRKTANAPPVQARAEQTEREVSERWWFSRQGPIEGGARPGAVTDAHGRPVNFQDLEPGPADRGD